MSKSTSLMVIIACGLLAGLICVASENPQKAFNSSQLSGPGNFFVAPNGNDKWSGRLPVPNQDQSDGPWATLEHARDVLRKLRAERDFREGLPKTITVWVRGGVYWLSRPLVFEAEDSGKSGSPVTYRAYPGEKPILRGGRPISNWTVHQGQILKADLSRTPFHGIYFRQLFFDGKRQHLARYPNFDPTKPYTGGWAYVDGKPVPMYSEIPGENRRTLRIKREDLRNWSRPEEAEVCVFPRYNWWNNIIRIASLDRQNGIATLAANASYPIRPNDRYYLRNLFEELDAPGEWYLDKNTWTVYFWPPGDIRAAKVYAPIMETLIEIRDASDIIIQGFTLECCEGTAVLLRNTRDCLIAANTIFNVGGRCQPADAAVRVEDGSGNGVVGNDIYEVGSHAIVLTGGDRTTLRAAGNYADNNYIHHTGVFYKQGVGVVLQGVGNRASHNLIHDCPRFGIQYSGNDHVIEFNHIRHVNLETADTGVIYSGGRDWVSPRGTVVRYNYFHDSIGFGQQNGQWTSPHYAWGIYLDDNSAEVHVYGNIVVRAIRGLIHFHCARDNLVENNIFVDGTMQQLEMNGWPDHSRHIETMTLGYEQYAKLPAWQKYVGLQKGGHPKDAIPMANNRFVRNIIYYHEPNAFAYKLRRLRLEHFECDNNILWHQGGSVLISLDDKPRTFQEWQQLGFDLHSLVADPKFVDPAKDDYRLQPDSPAFQLGFQPIPVEKIGPYADSLRASWPIQEAPGVREMSYK
ncbi:MAG: right-handed parallel beta-helix repeat-containing protein [Thermogutta sp.]